MPVLAGGQLIARVDPARENGVLVARHITVEPRFATPRHLGATATSIARALEEAASWVGCTGVAIERVVPEPVGRLVRAAL
jgi:uncharacterized protein YcaQ